MTDLQQQSSTGAPPGWYADPSGEAARRWWSGLGWTEHIEAPLAEPDQVAASAPASVADAAPVLDEDPQLTAAPRATTVSAALIGRDPDDIAREQSAWHSRSAPTVQRLQAGSISAAAPVARAAGHQRNWISGVAMFVAILSIPALGANVLGILPPLTVSIFSGAPVGIALLALVTAFRNSGRGALLSIVALALSAATLAAGIFVDHAILKAAVDVVLGWLPGGASA